MKMSALGHWAKMMMGEIKPPAHAGDRRYLDGRMINEDNHPEVVILRAIRAQGSMRPVGVLAATGFKKTTVYRVLDTLVREGVLEIVEWHDNEHSDRLTKHYILKKRGGK
jgi:DNA invertase Pin-like site-specific DNA recombinase